MRERANISCAAHATTNCYSRHAHVAHAVCDFRGSCSPSPFQAARFASLRGAPLVRAIFLLARSCRRVRIKRKREEKIPTVFCVPEIAARTLRYARFAIVGPSSILPQRVCRLMPPALSLRIRRYQLRKLPPRKARRGYHGCNLRRRRSRKLLWLSWHETQSMMKILEFFILHLYEANMLYLINRSIFASWNNVLL